jgi:hypothetical protein
LQSACTDMNSCPKPRPRLTIPELTIASQACTNISPEKYCWRSSTRNDRVFEVTGSATIGVLVADFGLFWSFPSALISHRISVPKGRSFAPGLPAAVVVLDSACIQDLRRGDFLWESRAVT